MDTRNPACSSGQLRGKTVRPFFRTTENDRLSRIFSLEQSPQQLKFSILIHRKIKLLDRISGKFFWREVHGFCIPHVSPRQSLNRAGNRGTKEQRLSLFRTAAQNLFDIGTKTDVEHPISFIKNDDIQSVHLQATTAHVVENTPWRANDNFSTSLQLFRLSPNRFPTIDR